jgi:reactive chlorine resistance protein C
MMASPAASRMPMNTDRSIATLEPQGFGQAGLTLMNIGSRGSYFALAIIFLWIGVMKFTDYEASGIAGFVMNSPIVGWWHALLGIAGTARMLGIYEIITGLFLAARVISPTWSVVGSLMSVLTYLITLTFFVTTPGVAEPLAGGFPGISAMPGQFLLKDVALLAISIYCLGESLAAYAGFPTVWTPAVRSTQR